MVNTMNTQTKQVQTTDSTVVEVKLTRAALKAQYALLKDAAKISGDTIEPFAQYKTNYDIQWDLTHPNQKDALANVSTDQVLATVDDALAATGAAVAVVKQEVSVSKAAVAKAIFKAELDAKGPEGLVRKDIIKRFVTEAGLTLPGANTYYQNERSAAGLVNKKA